MQDMMHHFLHPSVLERQRAQLQQLNNNNNNCNFSIENILSLQSEGLCHGWPILNMRTEEEFGTNATATVSNSTASLQAAAGTETSSKKRKAEKCTSMEGSDDDEEEKRIKDDQGSEGEKHQSNSKDNNINEKKPDYIHVRARRGQATDSHSLAERVRREKISERMKYLQGLVPGCNKITGKAGMLDEIINYVQSLQRQVEFLSMKLAAVNPRLDFNMEALFIKEMNLPCNSANSNAGMSAEMLDPSFLLQLNSLQQAIASCGLDMAMSPAEISLRRTTSMPVRMPEPFMDSSFNVQRTSSGWESELQNLYGVEFHQERGFAFPRQSAQGNLLSDNL